MKERNMITRIDEKYPFTRMDGEGYANEIF
jgi:hypothetical protein